MSARLIVWLIAVAVSSVNPRAGRSGNLVFALFGIALGLAMKLLWLAAIGFFIYLALRIVSPSTADRVRDAIKGRGAHA